jgi:uncharacterized protein (UPF0218 family)
LLGLKLTRKLRVKLKLPLGELIAGSPEEVVRKLSEIVKKEKPTLTICVGDVISRRLFNSDVPVDVMIVDNKQMRKKLEPFEFRVERKLYAENPSGTLRMGAWQAVKEAIERRNALLVIDGEEDLLTLPAILLAPENSIVVYGQPNVGAVVVRVDRNKRLEIELMVKSMIKDGGP